MVSKRVELGCIGHFICAGDCRWRRHTQIPGYRISSVGLYFPPYKSKDQPTPIGYGKESLFETMVFATTNKADESSDGCGCKVVKEWSEIEGRRYATAGAAQAGHEKLVAKYIARKAKP